MVSGDKKFTQEEELLLQDFSRDLSKKTTVMFYLNAFIVSAMQVFLYVRIHGMELMPTLPLFVIMTLGSTYLIAFAYKNTKFIMKHKVAQKIESAMTSYVLKQMGDKKAGKTEKDERVLWKKNEVSESSATTFALFYNNAMFLMLMMVMSFYVFASFSPFYNYVFTLSSSAGLVALFSTSTKQ